MSTLKVDGIRSNSATSDAITLANDGTCSANITSINGGPVGTKNLVINGAMRVNQYGNATGVDDTGYYAADRMKFKCFVGAERYSVSTVTDAPAGSGFTRSFKIETTTADTSPNTGTYASFTYCIEGYHVQHLLKGTSSAKPFTVSFWVKGNTNYSPVLEVADVTNTRMNVQTFNVTSSWTKVALTFVGDTSGALTDNANTQLQFNIWLKAAAFYSGGTASTQNTWVDRTNHNQRAALLTFDIGASTSNYFQITGFQIEEGSTATAFEHEPLGTTLARCQRYYYVHADQNNATTLPVLTAANYNNASGYGVIHFPTPMRHLASIVQSGGTNHWRGYGNNGSTQFDNFSLQKISHHAAEVAFPNTRGTGNALFVRSNANGSLLAFDSEI